MTKDELIKELEGKRAVALSCLAVAAIFSFGDWMTKFKEYDEFGPVDLFGEGFKI